MRSREAEGTIQVTARTSPEGECVLTVADNGQGLPPTSEDTKGSTLGLYLVDILVEQIDGRLLQVTNGSGTRFEVQFPLTAGS